MVPWWERPRWFERPLCLYLFLEVRGFKNSPETMTLCAGFNGLLHASVASHATGPANLEMHSTCMHGHVAEGMQAMRAAACAIDVVRFASPSLRPCLPLPAKPEEKRLSLSPSAGHFVTPTL